MSTAPPAHEGDEPWWNVAGHALFRVVDGSSRKTDLPKHPEGSAQPVPVLTISVSFEPVAILLSNQPKDPAAKLVYTPQKSESAYILAAMALRQAAIQTAIWVGHVSAGCGRGGWKGGHLCGWMGASGMVWRASPAAVVLCCACQPSHPSDSSSAGTTARRG